MKSNSPTSLLPSSPQEFVGFTVFCLRKLSIEPTPELRAQLRVLFETGRSIVSPAQAFPGWILNVVMASFFTLAAEGELKAAQNALAEIEAIDADLGGCLLDIPNLRERIEALRGEAAKLIDTRQPIAASA